MKFKELFEDFANFTDEQVATLEDQFGRYLKFDPPISITFIDKASHGKQGFEAACEFDLPGNKLGKGFIHFDTHLPSGKVENTRIFNITGQWSKAGWKEEDGMFEPEDK